MADLIERLRGYAEADDLHVDERATLLEAAAALEAAHADIDVMRETIMAEHDARIESEAALEAAREDAERLDWFDTNWFTAYRQCDPIDGLMKHCVVVDESQRSRRGLVADTMRDAIDQARGKGGAE